MEQPTFFHDESGLESPTDIIVSEAAIRQAFETNQNTMDTGIGPGRVRKFANEGTFVKFHHHLID
jgi:hypothetical protein